MTEQSQGRHTCSIWPACDVVDGKIVRCYDDYEEYVQLSALSPDDQERHREIRREQRALVADLADEGITYHYYNREFTYGDGINVHDRRGTLLDPLAAEIQGGASAIAGAFDAALVAAGLIVYLRSRVVCTKHGIRTPWGPPAFVSWTEIVRFEATVGPRKARETVSAVLSDGSEAPLLVVPRVFALIDTAESHEERLADAIARLEKARQQLQP